MTPLAAAAQNTEPPAATDVASPSEKQHSVWNELLGRYVKDGADGVNRFHYSALQGNPEDLAALNAYIDTLSRSAISELPRDEQFAAWANLYNALTVQLIIDNYPVSSIRQIKPNLFSIGPWKKELVEVEGEKLSLDDIEHGIMREKWDDARVHYAVNCASIGCPDIQKTAWEGATLDEDLNAAAIAYVNHPRGVTVRSDGKLQVSRIYKWYDEDFGGSERGIIDHLRKYAAPVLKETLDGKRDIADFEYDWSLNSVAKVSERGND